MVVKSNRKSSTKNKNNNEQHHQPYVIAKWNTISNVPTRRIDIHSKEAVRSVHGARPPGHGLARGWRSYDVDALGLVSLQVRESTYHKAQNAKTRSTKPNWVEEKYKPH